MKLQILGVGDAGTIENFHSNMLLEVDGKSLLIDAGGDIRRSLKAAGHTWHAVDSVFVSHLHADHFGGMELLALKSYFDPNFKNADGSKRRPKLFMHPSIRGKAWSMLRHGCQIPNQIPQLQDFFDVQTCGKSFAWEGIRFHLVPTTHCLIDSDPMPCFGLSWTTGKTKVWISGDTVFEDSKFDHLFEQSDLILHDCETGFRTPVHAQYAQLLTMSAEIRRKMWLYHYNDGAKPDCVGDGFAGWATQGQVFDL